MEPYIKRHDRVIATSGHFENKKGYVCRVHGNMACVVWKNVWEHGIWTNLNELKRTERYKNESKQIN